MKIHLLGPTCSGTSTLGKLIAEKYSIPWYDSDDILWENTDPPFTTQKERNERIKLLNEIFQNNNSLVLSGWTGGWGDFIKGYLDIVIYKYVEQDIRIKRLHAREKQRHGNRIEPGNDMYIRFKGLEEYVKQFETGGMDIRSRERQMVWLNNVKCKIIKLEENIPIEEELKIVIEEIEKIK